MHSVYDRSFLVATWYRPPSSCLDLFDENFIEKCDYENKQLIISGDMNCDYSKIISEAHTKKLQFISSTYQLEQLILEPTRVTNTSATQIDLIFTNVTRNIAGSGVAHIGLSDHSLSMLCGGSQSPRVDKLKEKCVILNILEKQILLVTYKICLGMK